MSENGGEFCNEHMRELCEAFNIKVLNTAAESPWSNGVCERQNAVIGDMVRKVMEDSSCELDVALSWAVAARNSLSNNSGFSPNHLVFGFNPAFPNNFDNLPPALEKVSSSDIVRSNLTALHSAREQFMKYECSEKLQRALRTKKSATCSSESCHCHLSAWRQPLLLREKQMTGDANIR